MQRYGIIAYLDNNNSRKTYKNLFNSIGVRLATEEKEVSYLLLFFSFYLEISEKTKFNESKQGFISSANLQSTRS